MGQGQSFLSRLFGGGKDADAGGGRGATRISNRELARAIDEAQDDPQGILEARLMIEQLGDQLSNAERAEAYRRLAAATTYRSQKDNRKDPDSTCNFTSMAMAFEGLGVDYQEEARGKQAEEQLYERFYQKGMGSRVDEHDRVSLARDQGLSVSHLETPAFGSGAEARTWFQANVSPRLQAGAQATLGIRSGTFRHVVRLQWVEAKGLRIDDPWGAAVGYGEGEFGYSKLNAAPGKGAAKTLGEDQPGVGDDGFLPWDTVAKVLSDRYVQIYDARASKVAARSGRATG